MRGIHDYFKGKQVTVMGLGLLGRGVGDAMFLAKHGAKLTVTDLRDEHTLAPSLAKLKKYNNIRYRLGEHRREDFRDKDFILKAAGVPLDSPYIAEARKRGIPIEMDASLFAKLVRDKFRHEQGRGANLTLQQGSGQVPKGVVLVGVTGTRGKSTTTALIYEILKERFKIYDLRFKKEVKDKGLKIKDSARIFKGGNLVSEATLPLLKKVRAGDIVVLELDSWQLQGFHAAKLSPRVAVFTTFMDDHLVYYKGDRKKYFEDKSAIFRYQKRGDVLVVGEQAAGKIKNQKSKIKMVVTHASDVPKDWNLKVIGEHNRANIACAVAAARALGISDAVIKRAVEKFRGVPGRLEYLRTVKGVKIYNDNNATTPDATIAALRALNSKSQIPNHKQVPISKSQTDRKIILICGGTDKGLDMSELISAIPKYCKALILLNETGTDKLIFNYQFPIFKKETLKECVGEAMKIAKKGDIILFSPAFASFGKWFKNEYDRGEQFVKLVKNLK